MLKRFIDRLTTIPLVGVDLGSAMLKVVELERVGTRPILRHCAVASVGGGEPVTLLKRLLTDARVTTSHAALGVASPTVMIRPLQFPPMPKKELANAIHLEAEQAVLNGHALTEMAVDWHPFKSSSKHAIRGLLAVVPKTLIATQLQAAKAAGLRPAIVDVEGLAVWNAYWELVGREGTPKTVLLVNVGARTTNLVIATGPDELVLIRDLQLGGQAIVEEGQGHEWATEVRDSVGYARSQAGLRAIDAAYLTGGGSSAKVLSLLESTVAAPVTFWNPLSHLARDAQSPTVEESVGPLLTVAIGLALRQP